MASVLQPAEALETCANPASPHPIHTTTETTQLDATRSAKPNRFDAIRLQLYQSSSSVRNSGHTGIPTPPQSESTSGTSASSRTERSQKGPRDAVLSDHQSLTRGLLEPSVTARPSSTSPRSASVTSSSTNTGSDTIGAISPRSLISKSRFRSTRQTTPSAARMAANSAAVTSPDNTLDFSQPDIGIGDLSASSSALRPGSSVSSHANSPSQRRMRRSEMHERDVSQIRSESQLGFRNDDVDDEVAINERAALPQQQHPFPNSSQHKYSPRKSTTLSVASSRYDKSLPAENCLQIPLQRDSPRTSDTHSPSVHPSASSSRYVSADDMPSGSTSRLVRTTGRASGRLSLDDRTSPRLSTASRSPMPSEFRLPDKKIRRAYRAAHQRKQSDDSEGSETREDLLAKPTLSKAGDHALLRSPKSTRRESLDEIQEESAKREPASARSPQNRRRRYASDAAADEATQKLDYDGRLGTQSSRISVDSSSAQRHLATSSLHSTPSSSSRRTQHSLDFGSPSEQARARKISSTSSNRSQKSSNSASELHRAASRVSLRRQYGSDLFSAEPSLPQPSTDRRPRSPSTTSLTNSSDRSRRHLDHPRRVDDTALGQLRHQIQDLHVGRSAAEHDRRQLLPISLRTRAQPASTRSSLSLESPSLGSARAQSVIGLQRTPHDTIRTISTHQYPFTDPQRSRYDRMWPAADPSHSSDAVHRIRELVDLRAGGLNSGQTAPQRSSTALGTAKGCLTSSPRIDHRELNATGVDEPAPIRNLAVRLAQYEALYTKTPFTDATVATAQGPHTLRTVELMGAIVRGTSTMWAELASMHPIATEGHLMGRQGDAFTDAFGQLDEGLAFVNKLVLEQARAMQDLLFLLDRTEKERQAQFNQALVEMGHSPRPFSRIGGGGAASVTPAQAKFVGGSEPSGTGERSNQLLRRAASSVRSGNGLQSDSPSAFIRSSRGVGAERGGTLTASQLRSMTSLGHISHHGRSASELSPSSAAAQRRLDRVVSDVSSEEVHDSPLSSRRSAIGRPFPTSGAHVETEVGATGATTSRPAPAFTPRRPRLSNPSVSNATASFQPSAASAGGVSASSAEDSMHDGSGVETMGSGGSTVGGEGEVHEFGEVLGERPRGSETVRLSWRGQRGRSERNATIRGARVVDALATQLDASTGRDGQNDESMSEGAGFQSETSAEAYVVQRRHTLSHDAGSASVDLLDAEALNRSSTKLSQYGLTKAANPPPRPPRHVHRPQEERIASPSRQELARNQASTPTSKPIVDADTPRQKPHPSAPTHDDGVDNPSQSLVRSLGRSAARRVSRIVASSQ